MKVLRIYKPNFATHPTAHFGTFPFLSPRQATANKNVKEPKLSNLAPTSMTVCSIITRQNLNSVKKSESIYLNFIQKKHCTIIEFQQLRK